MKILALSVRSCQLLLAVVIGLLTTLSSCDRHEEITIDEFYHFSKLSKITLEKPRQLNYFLGIDTYSIPLSATTTDAEGNPIETPTKAITYYANSNKLDGEVFQPQKAGLFNLVGKLAGQVSDTIKMNVWDPASLTLRLSTLNGNVSEILANGKDSVRFVAELLSAGKSIRGNFPITVSVNEQTTGLVFATKTPGDYYFKASAFGIKSNIVKIAAVARTTSFSIVRMPVIFHEINGSQLTAAKVLELTNGMTAAHRNRLNNANQAKDANAVDNFVEFYPAPTGIDGKTLATPGLERVTSSKKSFSQREIFYDSFSYFWEPTRYINIWVYHNITGDFADASWAYLPTVTRPLEGVAVGTRGQTPNLPYGIVLNANHLLNRTDEILSHEVGHMLALAHVFDGNGSNVNACSENDPDYCQDTPSYDRAAYVLNLSSIGSSSYSRVSCAGESYVATNFMDYDYCYNNSFTKDQQTRVRHAVDYALWLPTPYNGFAGGRVNGQSGLVKYPGNLVNVKPIICNFSHVLPNR